MRALDVVCTIRVIGAPGDDRLARIAAVLQRELGDLAAGEPAQPQSTHTLDIVHDPDPDSAGPDSPEPDTAGPDIAGPDSAGPTRPGRAWTIEWDGDAVHHLTDAANALAAVMSELSARASMSVATTHTVLHAATIAVPDAAGRPVAVGLVGAGGAGKSTLAAACVRHGLAYLSDELCCIAPDGTVRAFHRPLCLRPGGARLVGLDTTVEHQGDDLVVPVRVGGLAGSGGLADRVPLGAILFLDRRSDLCRLDRITPGRALFRLSDQTVGPPETVQPQTSLHLARIATFRRLEAIVRTVPVRSMRYGDLGTAVELLRREIPGLVS